MQAEYTFNFAANRTIVMNRKNTITLNVSVFMIAQIINLSWAGAPPNPTQSDALGNTAGGRFVLENNTATNNTGFGSNALV